MTDHTLLPCPFCGGEAELLKGDPGLYSAENHLYHALKAVVCDQCISSSGWYLHEEEAIAAWNRRTPPDVNMQDYEMKRSAALEEDNRRLREAIRKADRRLDDLASVPLGSAAAVVVEAHLHLKGAIRQPAPDGEMSKG